MVHRRRFSLALGLVAFLGVVWLESSGCRRKADRPGRSGLAKSAEKYKPPPTYVYPSPRPGEARTWPTVGPDLRRPTLPR